MISDLNQLAESLCTTERFISKWIDKPEYELFQMSEKTSNNYIVFKDGYMILWARTLLNDLDQVCIHSREAIAERIGEDKIRNIETKFTGTRH